MSRRVVKGMGRTSRDCKSVGFIKIRPAFDGIAKLRRSDIFL